MKTTLKPDSVLKDFWRNNDRFADLFNQIFFQGEASIDPAKLADKDTEESSIIMGKERIAAISRTRDIIKQYEDGAELVLIGLENQMRVHYAIPVRQMLYDALRYTRQCKVLENEHRKAKDLKDPDEFLSGIAKNDRIKPVISLIIYYGEKSWDGPISLSDMMEIPPLFQKFFNDQSIQLLQVGNAGNYTFENKDNQDFFTLLEAFYNNDGKVDLDNFKSKYPNMEIYWETLAAIGAATGSMELVEYAQEHKGGRLDMCVALENLKEEGKVEGKKEGKHRRYDLSNVGVIISIAPFFTAILAHWLLNSEKLGVSFFIGFVVALVGILLISFNGGTVLKLNPTGDLLAVLAAIVWAIYSVLSRKISQFGYNTIQTTRRIFCYGLSFMVPVLFLFNLEVGLERFTQPSNYSIFFSLGSERRPCVNNGGTFLIREKVKYYD